jgi:hypothetical protein
MFNMRSNSLVLSFLWILSLIVPAALFCEDFTFNVPIELNNLHLDIEKGSVNCYVEREDGVGIGGAIGEFNITNGNYNGIFTVAFNAAPGRDPAKGTQWCCGLFLKARGYGYFQRPSILFSNNPEYKYDTTKPFIVSDCGNIPASNPKITRNPKK